MKSGFSKHFSMVSIPNRVLTYLKSASGIRISSFVHPSKIFVWEGYNWIRTLPLPNEDFGRSDEPFRMRFRSTFQGCEYSISATNRLKVLPKWRFRKGSSDLPKSSFGEHKLYEDLTILTHMLGSQTDLPNPVWLFLANVVSHMVRSPNRALTPLKSASNIRISIFCSSEIVVWDG